MVTPVAGSLCGCPTFLPPVAWCWFHRHEGIDEALRGAVHGLRYHARIGGMYRTYEDTAGKHGSCYRIGENRRRLPPHR